MYKEYKEWRQKAKREMAKAKKKTYDELYEKLDTKEGEKDLYRLARQRDRAGKDVLQVRVIKGRKWECADERGECVEKVDGVL